MYIINNELKYDEQIIQFDCILVCFAVVCGVGADVAYHRHIMGYYVT